jgi:hypothetical protein
MRRVLALVASLCLAAVLTASALAGDGRLSFTTGNFVVTCTSTGQFCKPAKLLELTLPRPGTMTRVIYTSPKTHCSAVRVFVLRGRRTVAKLPRLEAGEATARVTTSVRLKKGTTTLRFRAKGFTGGCNTGYVGSWGGKVTVKVRLD